jgi:hypothetical protein
MPRLAITFDLVPIGKGRRWVINMPRQRWVYATLDEAQADVKRAIVTAYEEMQSATELPHPKPVQKAS